MLRCATGLLLATCLTAVLAEGETLQYPKTRRVDQTDEYHGTKVADPYRWLEDDVRSNEEVRAWVEAENKVTFGYLEQIPERKAIVERLTELWNYERYSAPFKAGDHYYFYKNNGLQNQSVLYGLASLDGEPQVIIDPNSWNDEGTSALKSIAFSDDGRYLAYARAEAGSDWVSWLVRDLKTGKDLADKLEWIKFSDVSWTPDNRGFFYARYDAPEEGAFVGRNEYNKLYYHRLGSQQSDDVLVYERSDEPDWGFDPTVSEDGRYLIITTWEGTDNNLVSYKDLSEPYGMVTPLVSEFDADYWFVGNDGPVFWFQTDNGAPLGQVIAIDVRNPGREHWKTVIAEAEDKLEGVSLVNNLFIATYLKDACTRARVFDTSGRLVRELELPGIGSASGFGGKRSETETFYSFASFDAPPSIYHVDLITGESRLMRRAEVPVDLDQIEVKQVFYTSKDGTRVPMFLVHKQGIELDGSNPTLLYGYGGFNISLTPYFSVARLTWVDMGGVYAVANLRGGGEYGEEWHQAGTKLQKQNVFDDFIAAAETLIADGYTRPDKLAIAGGSNGGLLVGACMVQRPDLFGVCLPAVGVLDMLRFHEFTIGRAWTSDYGCSENADEFEALAAYSPYHNLQSGTSYPATMVTTADTDDRVVPGHSFKFAAQLQHCQAGDAPVLIRIETSAGHGAGTPTSKRIEEIADSYAFMVKNLGMKLEPQP